MTTFSDVRRGLIVHTDVDNRATSELRHLLLDRRGSLEEIGSGTYTAHDARRVLEIRGRTSRSAGIDPLGIEELLERLSALPDDASLEVFHFGTPQRFFSVSTGPDGRVVGCVSAPRRGSGRSP